MAPPASQRTRNYNYRRSSSAESEARDASPGNDSRQSSLSSEGTAGESAEKIGNSTAAERHGDKGGEDGSGSDDYGGGDVMSAPLSGESAGSERRSKTEEDARRDPDHSRRAVADRPAGNKTRPDTRKNLARYRCIDSEESGREEASNLVQTPGRNADSRAPSPDCRNENGRGGRNEVSPSSAKGALETDCESEDSGLDRARMRGSGRSGDATLDGRSGNRVGGRSSQGWGGGAERRTTGVIGGKKERLGGEVGRSSTPGSGSELEEFSAASLEQDGEHIIEVAVGGERPGQELVGMSTKRRLGGRKRKSKPSISNSNTAGLYSPTGTVAGGEIAHENAAEMGRRPDPAEAQEMLGTLAELSAKLQRVTDAVEEARVLASDRRKLGDARENDASYTTPRGLVVPALKVSKRQKNAASACERCLSLSETTELMRERLALLERLLEHSENLRRAAEDRTGGPSVTEKSTTTSFPAASGVELPGSSTVASAAEERDSAPRENGGRLEGEGTDDGGVGEDRKEDGDKATEELLAATEAVWRISEMAREVLEGELDRRGEALSAAKAAAKEAGEAISSQVKTKSFSLLLIRGPSPARENLTVQHQRTPKIGSYTRNSAFFLPLRT